MYLGNAGPDYQAMYGHHTMAPNHEIHAAGAFGRMSLGDQALEKLAANVRAATTTSASDRAKQIFVQQWYASAIHTHYFLFFYMDPQADR